MIKPRTYVEKVGSSWLPFGMAGDADHDLLLLHALLRAIEEVLDIVRHKDDHITGDAMNYMNRRATEILRDDFGIEP